MGTLLRGVVIKRSPANAGDKATKRKYKQKMFSGDTRLNYYTTECAYCYTLKARRSCRRLVEILETRLAGKQVGDTKQLHVCLCYDVTTR